jgi:hypothetical protein
MNLTLTATVECAVCAAKETVSGPVEISGSVLLFVESAEAFFAFAAGTMPAIRNGIARSTRR